MPVMREEPVPKWLPIILGIVVVGFLLFFLFFSPSKRLGPREAWPAELVSNDTLLTDCGTLTRTDSTKTDTTFGWIEYEDGIRARPAFRFLTDTVEVGKKYELTYDAKYVVLAVKPMKKCSAPATKSAGVSFSINLQFLRFVLL